MKNLSKYLLVLLLSAGFIGGAAIAGTGGAASSSSGDTSTSSGSNTATSSASGDSVSETSNVNQKTGDTAAVKSDISASLGL